jgi:hypothetical protein
MPFTLSTALVSWCQLSLNSNIVVCVPVDAAASRVVEAQGAHSINAGAFAAGPFPEVGGGAAQPGCGVFCGDLDCAGAAEINT